MSPNTRVVGLMRVRLKSFLCKYYFSRMSKFHSSFSLDFFLAKFPKHISFCKQCQQEGATPSLSCSCSCLGVQLSRMTSPHFSRHTSSCSCHRGRREHEKGDLRKRGRVAAVQQHLLQLCRRPFHPHTLICLVWELCSVHTWSPQPGLTRA